MYTYVYSSPGQSGHRILDGEMMDDLELCLCWHFEKGDSAKVCKGWWSLCINLVVRLWILRMFHESLNGEQVTCNMQECMVMIYNPIRSHFHKGKVAQFLLSWMTHSFGIIQTVHMLAQWRVMFNWFPWPECSTGGPWSNMTRGIRHGLYWLMHFAGGWDKANRI